MQNPAYPFHYVVQEKKRGLDCQEASHVWAKWNKSIQRVRSRTELKQTRDWEKNSQMNSSQTTRPLPENGIRAHIAMHGMTGNTCSVIQINVL